MMDKNGEQMHEAVSYTHLTIPTGGSHHLAGGVD